MGLGEHEKRVETQAGGDIQGLFVEPDLHKVGLVVFKRAMLWGAGLRLLTQMRPSVRSLERVVGKLGFAAFVRLCLRAASRRRTFSCRGLVKNGVGPRSGRLAPTMK